MTTPTRRWWRRDDRYYWMTAQLAARGLRTLTMRLLAGATLAFGILPTIMELGVSDLHGRLHHAVTLTIAAVCVVLSIGWLRRTWPPKTWSAGYVVTLSICIAVTCLIEAEPLAGLLASVAFSALMAYIAMFHSARLLALTALVTAVTLVVLAVRLALAGNLVLAICAVALLVLVNIVVPSVFHAVIHPLAGGIPNVDIDPLTGLLNRDAFYRAVSELISVRGRTDDRYLVLVLVVLDNFSLLTGTRGQGAGDRASIATAQTLREVTRADAILAHNDNAEYLIVDTFKSADVTPLVERVRSAVATTPPRLTGSIGAVVTPLRALADLPPYDVVDKLIAIADTAVGEARGAGGNQARYIECDAPLIDEHNLDADDPW